MTLTLIKSLLVALLSVVLVQAQQGITVTVYPGANCASSSGQQTYYLTDSWSECQALPASEFLVGHARCEDGHLILEYCNNRTCNSVGCFGPTTIVPADTCSENVFLTAGSVKVACPADPHARWLSLPAFVAAWIGFGASLLTAVVFIALYCKAKHSDPMRAPLIR